MRIPDYLSPSSLSKFEKEREDFYLKYMAEPRPEREPQSQPASVGSAFDAYVKANLRHSIFGLSLKKELTDLFESQVEVQNRDFAREAGEHCFASYVHSGAYKDLRDMMVDAQEEPKFEFEARVEINGVPLMGKPDARFIHKNGTHVILDWKVNGYCATKYAKSPTRGYKKVRDGLGWPKPSRSHGKSHDLYKPFSLKDGLEVNEYFLENFSIDWADQLTIYGWMMGETPGDETVLVAIDQIVSKPNGEKPLLRIAQHRSRVSMEYQNKLIERLTDMWEAVQTGHIFTDLTEEENADYCSRLDSLAAATNDEELGNLFRGTSQYRAR